jgi:hypothetical protein
MAHLLSELLTNKHKNYELVEVLTIFPEPLSIPLSSGVRLEHYPTAERALGRALRPLLLAIARTLEKNGLPSSWQLVLADTVSHREFGYQGAAIVACLPVGQIDQASAAALDTLGARVQSVFCTLADIRIADQAALFGPELSLSREDVAAIQCSLPSRAINGARARLRLRRGNAIDEDVTRVGLPARPKPATVTREVRIEGRYAAFDERGCAFSFERSKVGTVRIGFKSELGVQVDALHVTRRYSTRLLCDLSTDPANARDPGKYELKAVEAIYLPRDFEWDAAIGPVRETLLERVEYVDSTHTQVG